MKSRIHWFCFFATFIGSAAPAAGQSQLPYLDTIGCDAAPSAATDVSDEILGGREPRRPGNSRLAWNAALDATPLARRPNFGVGYLVPTSSLGLAGGSYGGAYYSTASIPLFSKPDGDQWGVIHKGWIVDQTAGGVVLSGVDSDIMIQADWHKISFLVLQAREDGWLRFRWGKNRRPRSGIAWVHLCHLRSDNAAFKFISWAAEFASGRTVVFRDHGKHSLRAGPGVESELLRFVGGGPGIRSCLYEMTVMRIDGDWMRVSVREPAKTDDCYLAKESKTKGVYEGWVKWWSEKPGPWIWYRRTTVHIQD